MRMQKALYSASVLPLCHLSSVCHAIAVYRSNIARQCLEGVWGIDLSPRKLSLQIERGELGNPPAMQIMEELKPKYWFSAHHHVKFAAMVQHRRQADTASSSDQLADQMTKFLALDKCLPGRRFLQVTQAANICTADQAALQRQHQSIAKRTRSLS